MSSAVSFSTNSTATDNSLSDHNASTSDVVSRFTTTDDVHLLSPRTEQAHVGQHAQADRSSENYPSTDTLIEDATLTPGYDSRRTGFDFGLQPVSNEQPQTIRNPLGPDQPRTGTPPPLAEIIRRMTNDDPHAFRKPALLRVDSVDLQFGSAGLPTPSTVCETPSRIDARRSSIVAFARNIARHVPDVRMPVSPENPINGIEGKSRRESRDDAFSKDIGRGRKISIALPPAIKSRKRSDTTYQPHNLEKEEASSEPNTATPSTQTPPKGSLRDRRKVKLDLSLPAEIPNLPLRNRPPPSAWSSITPSRPRSPTTPWVRNEIPPWEIGKLPKSTPIIEEEYYQNDSASHPGFLPGNDVLFSSQSPKYDYRARIPRDRPPTSRPRYNRSRSSRSGTGDSSFGESQDLQGHMQNLQEHQAQTQEELQDLGMSTKTARLRRWRWGGSSDEPLQSPQSVASHSSFNPFKRSNRFSEEPGIKAKKNSPFSSRLLFRRQSTSTSPDPMSALANMPVPPQFVPPGLQRVPTPPIFDANGEVKGKLADFFFDVHATSAGRRKPRRSPGGVWDSDALLMSLSSDLEPSDNEDEEGPEGPIITPTPMAFDAFDTPGLIPGPGGDILGFRQQGRGADVDSSPIAGQDGWFRIPHNINVSDEQEAALREEEERRKFEWLVPEHLPTSPLCPLHPKYKGPCKGMCVWHSVKNKKNRTLKRSKTERVGDR